MKIEIEKFNGYVVRFLKEALLASAKSPMTKFRIGFAVGSGRAGLFPGTPAMAALEALGVVDGDAVDTDQLRRCVEGGLDAAGDLRVDALGISVERADALRFLKLVETGTLPPA